MVLAIYKEPQSIEPTFRCWVSCVLLHPSWHFTYHIKFLFLSKYFQLSLLHKMLQWKAWFGCPISRALKVHSLGKGEWQGPWNSGRKVQELSWQIRVLLIIHVVRNDGWQHIIQRSRGGKRFILCEEFNCFHRDYEESHEAPQCILVCL